LPTGSEEEKKEDNVPQDEETKQEVKEDVPAAYEQAEGHKEPATPAVVQPSPITWDSLRDKKIFNFDIMPKVLV